MKETNAIFLDGVHRRMESLPSMPESALDLLPEVQAKAIRTYTTAIHDAAIYFAFCLIAEIQENDRLSRELARNAELLKLVCKEFEGASQQPRNINIIIPTANKKQ